MNAEATNRRRWIAVAGAALAGCAGVPLATMARLATLRPDDLLAADPRQVSVALDVDARVKPAAGRAPVVDLALEPVDPAAFAPLELALPSEPDPTPVRDLGLAAPAPGRHWLVYRLTEPAARDLALAQATMRRAREAKHKGRLSLEVRNDWIAEFYPVARGSAASTWLRLARADGYFELWSGRIPATAPRTT